METDVSFCCPAAFFCRAGFFRDVLSRRFSSFGEPSSSKGFFPWASWSAFTSAHQIFPVPGHSYWHFLFNLFMDVDVGFDMRLVYKDHSGC